MPTRKEDRWSSRPALACLLQWGRVVADAEGSAHPGASCQLASVLQWGRVVADAEGRPRRGRTRGRRCGFNGAASLPTRKATTRANSPTSPTCFNGAASLPTRKAACDDAETDLTYTASMGPRRCRRGRPPRHARALQRDPASMGPRRCRRGRRRSTQPMPWPSSSFNGAASLPTRKAAEVAALGERR